jgi:hypothetical protein
MATKASFGIITEPASSEDVFSKIVSDDKNTPLADLLLIVPRIFFSTSAPFRPFAILFLSRPSLFFPDKL